MGFAFQEQPPESLPLDAIEYLGRLIKEIDIALSDSAIIPRQTDLFGPPLEGKIYYFRNAAPSEPLISSQGYWGYSNGVWVKFHV